MSAPFRIEGPGVYEDMPAETYHADPAPEPALSAGLAETITTRTPLHAWCDSRRLNPDWEAETSDRFDLGSMFHAAMTGEQRDMVSIDAPSWQTKAAREARDEARAAGKIALLAKDHERVERMCEAARAQLRAALGHDPFEIGVCEASIFWIAGPPGEIGGECWNRCRPDGMVARGGGGAGGIIYDLKSTGETADPVEWSKRAYRFGVDLRAAMYVEGAEAIRGGTWLYRYVPVETKPPHALSILELDEDAIAIGRKKLAEAQRLWRECLEAGRWPAWPARVAVVSAPRWAESDWLAREERNEALRALSPTRSMIDAAIEFQAPARGAR